MSVCQDPRFLRYFELFNRGDYFEAHEVLEGLWRECRDSSRDFYQGLIQIAAVFVHLQKKNLPGAENLLEKASRYLLNYSPTYLGINIREVLDETRECLKHPGSKPNFFRAEPNGNKIQDRARRENPDS